MANIQYISDLHISDWPQKTPFEQFVTPVAPILVIAGDICSAWDPLYRHFLAWCARNWYKVILITGNHEYYCEEGQERSIEETDAYIAALVTQFPNVVFLQHGGSYVLPGTNLRFVGTTLWSDISPAIWDDISPKKGDYKATYTEAQCGLRRTHPSDNCARHDYQKECLRRALLPWTPYERLVVITHHMPTMALLEDHFKGETWCTCYASCDEDLFFNPSIIAWICGHSHRSTKYKAPCGPWMYMNARGYNRAHEVERTIDVYDPKAALRIKL
jgi:UDP-2,3-diacylglucosamine pyrophosphatase LpxH